MDKILAALKSTPRTGWMLRGVHAAIAESIAEHMEEATILALYLGEKLGSCGARLDVLRAAGIAAVHDAAEAIVGDIVKFTADAMGKKLKEEIELKALRSIFTDTIIARLAEEYMSSNSQEALLAKLSEQLATLLQALRYIEQGYRDVCEIAISMSNSIDELLAKSGWSSCLNDVVDVVRRARSICQDAAKRM